MRLFNFKTLFYLTKSLILIMLQLASILGLIGFFYLTYQYVVELFR